jgi:methyltransferase (TIGR00027 family)
MTSTLAAQQKVSLTATDCAAIRAAVQAQTRCQSFDYLAADLLRGATLSWRARVVLPLVRVGGSALALRLASRVSPGADVFMFARTAVPDDLIRSALDQYSGAQVVILGAGLDSSALRISAERRSRGLSPGTFFEVDLSATQAEKRRQVSRVLRERPTLSEQNIRYVPCSFGEHELGRALRAAAFDVTRPTVWVWSGVVHYLAERDVRATIAELKALSAPGSLLFFDFILLEAYERPEQYAFARIKARFDSYGEVMSFGFHEGTGHVRSWLHEQGLSVVRSYTHTDMVEVYRSKTGCDPLTGGTPWANLCIARFDPLRRTSSRR